MDNRLPDNHFRIKKGAKHKAWHTLMCISLNLCIEKGLIVLNSKIDNQRSLEASTKNISFMIFGTMKAKIRLHIYPDGAITIQAGIFNAEYVYPEGTKKHFLLTAEGKAKIENGKISLYPDGFLSGDRKITQALADIQVTLT